MKTYTHYVTRTDAPSKLHTRCFSLAEAKAYVENIWALASPMESGQMSLSVCESDGTEVATLYAGQWID